LIGRRHGKTCGYAAIVEEIGKSEPITFMAGVDPEGRVGEVALMVFRESRGAEGREPRFMRQFKGKQLKDPIRVNQDILNYTGATLSSEAMARGVKKALALVDHFYLRRRGALGGRGDAGTRRGREGGTARRGDAEARGRGEASAGVPRRQTESLRH